MFVSCYLLFIYASVRMSMTTRAQCSVEVRGQAREMCLSYHVGLNSDPQARQPMPVSAEPSCEPSTASDIPISNGFKLLTEFLKKRLYWDHLLHLPGS